MTRWLAITALVVGVLGVRAAHAKGGKPPDDSATIDDDDDQDDTDAASTDKAKPGDKGRAKPGDKGKVKPAGKDDDATVEDDDDEKDDKTVEDQQEAKEGDAGSAAATSPLVKQDLTGHDLPTTRKRTQFERDRFWVDKQDTDATADKTLIQGSFTSTSFLYTEFGGSAYLTPAGTNPPVVAPGTSNAASYSELWTDLRLQTDFRHIAGSRWDARVDARLRVVDEPPSTLSQYDTGANGTGSPSETAIQSGFNGDNEYELRELWIVRNGVRSDVTIGRQFIYDLGALKIDGVRVDYASSDRLTLLGFVGLYPIRGSRSITTDYAQLYSNSGPTGSRTLAGRFVGAAGGGGAYRVANAYGAIGAVALVPFAGEIPRIYGTSNGYYRLGSTLDIYHFALVDLIGNNDALGSGQAGLTNLSAGINYKPTQRLRLTASLNRVDTDTLNVQANAFLHNVEPGVSPAAGQAPVGANQVFQNESYILRLATNEARVGASAGLGNLERFEISTAVTYRQNPGFSLTSNDGMGNTPPTTILNVASAQGLEVWGGITDRRSIAGLRLSADVSRTLGLGSVWFQRNESLMLHATASREFAGGRGEWEVEASYIQVSDQLFDNPNQPNACTPISATLATLPQCYGTSSGTITSVGGLVYYRLDRNWLGIASASLNQMTNQATLVAAATMGGSTTITALNDSPVIGLTGFLRIAYRF
jgi:hypothetical protein